MIALVTVAVFVYRKPFTHLFSAVGYGTLGSTERAEVSLRDAGFTFRRNTLEAATVAIPGVAGYRAARWARRNPGQAATVAAGVAGGAGAAAAVSGATSAEAAAGTGGGPGAAGDAYASRFRPDAPPAADGDGEASPGSRRGASAASLARSRNMPETESGARTAPPLDLPPRPGAGNGTGGSGTGGSGPASAASSWSRGAGRSAAAGSPPSQSRATSGGPPRASGSNGTNGTNATNGTAGSGSRSSAPAWPHKAAGGWPGASTGTGPRQRPAAERRPAPPPAGQAAGPAAGIAQSSPLASGNGADEPRAMPFWLRPMRRDK